ncbi:cell division protein FtsL [Candidatus Daviesbacteria bacterium]|nr:cell division protein FtsL [Candidatus Daviesbacteria bacterium]
MLKKASIGVIILLILIALFGLTKQITKALQAGKRLDIATDEVSKLQDENRNLQQRLSEVKSLSFIEQQARDKLNLAKPNETVVIIPKEQIEKVLGESKKIEDIKLTNWQAWLKLVFK